ncbi:phosphate acyltransferase PlsX [Angelakisella massiliensis]|uniref:phosphate acyltransferase PlsX n=1 Tax=Angelakisella massiliensis TaxID=1871018 RepID=UPI0023A81298|nr:phosphate acyltransferase PlsX [Angelakisella massiliensis]
MKIIVDAFGGDHAPVEIIKGCRQAIDELGVEIILTGDEEKIKAAAQENQVDLKGMEIVHAPGVMPVEEEPTKLLKQYSDSSMCKGFQLLADGSGDAFVSAGSTGALVVGASLIVKRIKGIKRAMIGTVIPSQTGCYMLADSGANSECRPEMLRQFAMMGSIYMNRVYGVEKPRVGLVNIGTEDSKGTDLQVETNRLLRDSHLNYIGNIEPREIPLGGCDVAVCDGFTGNVLLKMVEGMGKMFQNELKGIFLTNFATKLGAVLVSGQLKEFKKKFDYKEHGGAMLMGARKPVIKAHGSSDAKAIKNAIRQAKRCCDGNIIKGIEEGLAVMEAAQAEAAPDSRQD